MLKDYKEEAESALKVCMETNENIVENYIEHQETQQFEEEQKKYREKLKLVVGKLTQKT